MEILGGSKCRFLLPDSGKAAGFHHVFLCFYGLKRVNILLRFFQYLLRLLPVYYRITTKFYIVFSILCVSASEFSQFFGCMV